MNWKSFDKLETAVPGAPSSVTNYRGKVEFDVRFGRYNSPLSLTGPDKERFRIEHKELDIAVEADTLTEAKELLRAKLAASEDFTGTWVLWMHVDVSGGYDGDDERTWGTENAVCQIQVKYYAELTTGSGSNLRRRHMELRGRLPQPFTGEFWRPTKHKDLSRLREGAAKPTKHSRPHTYEPDEVWAEATPELVETIRTLQRRLGESGDKVKSALSKKRFLETIDQVRSGGRLLGVSVTDVKLETETPKA